jgi:hypothetical protein
VGALQLHPRFPVQLRGSCRHLLRRLARPHRRRPLPQVLRDSPPYEQRL